MGYIVRAKRRYHVRLKRGWPVRAKCPETRNRTGGTIRRLPHCRQTKGAAFKVSDHVQIICCDQAGEGPLACQCREWAGGRSCSQSRKWGLRLSHGCPAGRYDLRAGQSPGYRREGSLTRAGRWRDRVLKQALVVQNPVSGLAQPEQVRTDIFQCWERW